MRFYIALILCAASLTAAYATAGFAASRAIAGTCPAHLDCSHPEPPCFEDEPCWNWVTMGNGERGWVSTWGTPKVGGPCHFARALAEHRIFRYRATQRMTGDATAIRMCRH